jgi:hypothetical protein
MARFIQAEFPTEHAGLARVTRGFSSIAERVRRFDGARGTATLLLAALVAALVVVANELVTTWTEGRLFAAWVVTWLVAFAALALFAKPARRVGGRLRTALRGWSEARKQAAEDDKLWSIALTDARVMADLSRAMSQQASTYRDLRGYY